MAQTPPPLKAAPIAWRVGARGIVHGDQKSKCEVAKGNGKGL